MSGAIADGLLGRLSVATEQGGAWQHDRVTGESLGDKDKIALRAQLEWDPSSVVNLRLGGHFSQDKSDEQGLYLLRPYAPANGAPTIPADTSRYATAWRLNPVFANIIGLDADAKPGLDNSNNGVDLTANVDFGGVKLTGITAYNKLIRREYGDWDASQYYDSDEYFNSDLNVFSQSCASHRRPAARWMGGGGVLLQRGLEGELLFRFHGPARRHRPDHL